MVCFSEQSSLRIDSVVSVRGSFDLGPFTAQFNYPVVYCGNTDFPDMTLIAAAWSPEGFAIAADGFQVEKNKPDIYTAQKIFHTPFYDKTGFAYACAGICRWSLPSGDYFDFIEATKRTTNDLAGTPFPNDPADYFNAIGKRLFQELDSPLERDIDSTSGFAETRLFFAGYANGTPLWAELVFSNTGTRFYPHVLARVTQSPKEFMVFAGSNTMQGEMYVSGKLKPPYYLKEAIDMVQEYAEMCIASNASIPDCKNLKGHIHVASIEKGGFTWVIEPIRGNEQ